MTIQKIKQLFLKGSESIIAREEDLCRIDAETGDGDHGVAIARVAATVVNLSTQDDHDTLGEYFEDITSAVMSINGGSCIPLCANIFDGMAEAAAGMTGTDACSLKELFDGALKGIRFISDAKVGEKTMIDSLEPAVLAAQACSGSEADILQAAAQAARKGSEATRNMVAKYGRAKNLKEASLGHLDAGSVSIATFLTAISDAANGAA